MTQYLLVHVKNVQTCRETLQAVWLVNLGVNLLQLSEKPCLLFGVALGYFHLLRVMLQVEQRSGILFAFDRSSGANLGRYHVHNSLDTLNAGLV